MAQVFTLQVDGLEDLLKAAERAGADVQPLNRAAITNSVNRIQSEARRRARHRTGTMQRSILTQVNYPNGQVSVDSKHGIFNELGTGVYGPKGQPIIPKTAKVLEWKGPGGMIFAKKIKGMRAQPFFKPGIDAAMGYVEGQFLAVMDKIIVGLGGR